MTFMTASKLLRKYNIGIPDLKPIGGIGNMASGFYHVLQLLKKDIASWAEWDLKARPAPLVIHMTDGENEDVTGDAERLAKEIMQIAVPDGNVLIENVFVTDLFKIPVSDFSAWSGFLEKDDAGKPYQPIVDKLLRMSSVLPESYRNRINHSSRLSLSPGTLMMCPDNTPEIVLRVFVDVEHSGLPPRFGLADLWEDS